MPNAAHDVRIYWDAGAGEIDFSAPRAAVAMNNSTRATRYTWQSELLTDGQEDRFCVRIATAPWRDGIEIQNTDSHGATAGSSLPAAPFLSAAVV